MSARNGISIFEDNVNKITTIDFNGDSAFYPKTGNPSGFLTAHQSLTNYYTKNETSSKEEISAAIIAISGDYLPLSAQNAAVGNQVVASAVGLAQGSQVSARDYSFAQGHMVSALHIASVQGISATAYDCAMAQGYEVSARQCAFAQGAQTTADFCSLAQGGHCSAWSASIAQGEYNTASLYSQAFGEFLRADDHTMAIGKYNERSANTPFVIGNGSANNARSDLFFINSTGGVSAAGKISANGVELGPGTVGDTIDLSAGEGISIVETADKVLISCTGAGGSNVHWYIDTPNEHTSADIDLTIQTTATLGGSYDRYLMNGTAFIGELIPSADTVNDAGKFLTVTAGSPRWGELPSASFGIKTEVVANSGLATANDILYIVTGN